jgi:hypothetical protein
MYKKLVIITLIFLAAPAAFSTQPLDSSKYIGIDEIKPGMDAWCLTVYEGTKVEKFGLEVISVVRDFEPGRNAILVKGTDPRFIHTGPVLGCSGSPVYIEGRLAGALSFMLTSFSKDPLYAVTPIDEMLRVGEKQVTQNTGQAAESKNLTAWNFASPVDLAAAANTFTQPEPAAQPSPSGAIPLPTVLVTSQLPAGAVSQLTTACSPLGFVPVSGLGGGSADANLAKNTNFEPGGTAVVPLVNGDLKVAALGTVTEVVGNKVYAFGHSLLGYGETDLPLATGQVNTVVASLMRSFKFGNALEVRGALTTDEATAIVGTIGKRAKTIPLTIRIDRYNDASRTYNCQMVSNEMLSPMMLLTALSAATSMRGPLPPEHCISYKITVGLDGFAPIVFENISSGDSASSMLKEGISTVGLLLNNPYQKVSILSVDIEAKILSRNIVSHIWSLALSDAKVKAGQTVDVSVVVEPYLAAKKTYDLSLRIPDNLKPGEYDLTVTGATGYEQFLRRSAPEKFRADNLPNLLEAIRNVADIRRDRLYLVFVLPASGVAIENAVLSDLPPSKAVVLQDDKRAMNFRPCQSWIEKSVPTDSIVGDSRTVHIKVEE